MKSAYLLTGRIFCGVCGGKLTGSTTTSGKGIKTRYYICSRHQQGHTEDCPKRYTVPADVVEPHILGLIRDDLLRLRDDQKLHEYVEAELRRLHGHHDDARDQLQRQLASLDQQLARLRDHLAAMKPETAESLGLYRDADELAEQRTQVEAELRAIADPAGLPPMGQLRAKIAAEFDAVESLIASGSVEERRALIACYVKEIQADPDSSTVRIGLYPTLLSQRIAGARVGISPTPLATPGGGSDAPDAAPDGPETPAFPRPAGPGEWWFGWGPSGVCQYESNSTLFTSHAQTLNP